MRATLRIALFAMIAALLSACVANTGASGPPTPPNVPPRGDEPPAAQAGGAGSAAEASATEAVAGSSDQPAGSSTATKLVPGVPVKLAAVSTIAAGGASDAPRAGSAVYRCGGNRSITIDNRRSSVTVLDPDGEVMVMPASPPGQYNRYGQKPYALVLDGNEALYVKPRKAPFTCKR